MHRQHALARLAHDIWFQDLHDQAPLRARNGTVGTRDQYGHNPYRSIAGAAADGGRRIYRRLCRPPVPGQAVPLQRLSGGNVSLGWRGAAGLVACHTANATIKRTINSGASR